MGTADDVTSFRLSLPLAGSVRGRGGAERADAARNRHALLVAARRIAAESGVDALSMENVAARAGVGIGTVYRRFGDRSGLAYALLDDVEHDFQAAFLTGPSPLGPGAPAAERIRAFLHAYIDRLEAHGDLFAIAQSKAAGTAYISGAYSVHRLHLRALVSQLLPEGPDTGYLADALLAPLRAELFLHQRRGLGLDVHQIKEGLDRLICGLSSPPT